MEKFGGDEERSVEIHDERESEGEGGRRIGLFRAGDLEIVELAECRRVGRWGLQRREKEERET